MRTITKTVPKPSFFHYFSQPLTDEEEEEDEEPKEDEDEEKIKLTMEEDYDIGHTIRTAIIPQAVEWYLTWPFQYKCGSRVRSSISRSGG